MMYAVPFRAEHALALTLQPSQSWGAQYMTFDVMRELECVFAHTLMVDGTPIACCGAVPFGAHRALVWALIGDQVSARIFVEVHKWAKQFLDGLPFRRLEAVAEPGFDAANRWLVALGFELEAPKMTAFFEHGGDGAGYARIGEAP